MVASNIWGLERTIVVDSNFCGSVRTIVVDFKPHGTWGDPKTCGVGRWVDPPHWEGEGGVGGSGVGLSPPKKGTGHLPHVLSTAAAGEKFRGGLLTPPKCPHPPELPPSPHRRWGRTRMTTPKGSWELEAQQRGHLTGSSPNRGAKDGWVEGWMKTTTDGWMKTPDGRRDGNQDGRRRSGSTKKTRMDGRTEKTRMDGDQDGWTDREDQEAQRRPRWMEGWRRPRWMDTRMDGRTEKTRKHKDDHDGWRDGEDPEEQTDETHQDRQTDEKDCDGWRRHEWTAGEDRGRWMEDTQIDR